MNEQDVLHSIQNLNLDFRNDKDNICSMYMNNENVEKEIRGQKVSHYVSYLSKYPLIRKKIVSSKQDVNLPDFGRR